MSLLKDFILEGKSQLRNYEIFSVEIAKLENAKIFEKIEVTRPSLIQICIAYDSMNRIHCGIIVKNDFQVEKSPFSFAIIHLLPIAHRVKIVVHFRNDLEDCKRCLACVYGNSQFLDKFLLSELTENNKPFKVLQPWVERTLDREFVLSLTETNRDEYFNGTNCLKFVESFSRAFDYTISSDFSDDLKKILLSKSKIDIKGKENAILELAYASKTCIPPSAYEFFFVQPNTSNSNTQAQSNQLGTNDENSWCVIL
jgi:hypothetical protein